MAGKLVKKEGAETLTFEVTFEMFDLESSEIIWSGIYEFLRAAADNAVYR